MTRHFSLALVALICLFAGHAQAQASPEAVAHAYVAAIRAKGMTATADFIHPDELKRFQAMLLPLFADADAEPAQLLARGLFGPEATAESINALEPAEFMRGFMRMVDTQLKDTPLSVGDAQILGAVKEGDVVHLVSRNTVGVGELQLTQLEVISLKPYQDTWRLMLTGKMEGIAQALKAQAGKPR